MGGPGGGGTTTSIQDIPPAFRPAFTALFNSAFGAARTAAGQPGFGQQGFGGQATNLSNSIAGFGSPFSNPFQQPQQGPGISQGPVSVPGGGGKGSPEQFGIGQGAQQRAPDPFGAPQGGAKGGTEQFGLGAGQSAQPQVQGQPQAPQVQAPFGSPQGGSRRIPLAGGPPIIGQRFPEQFTAGTSPLEFESLFQREGVARQLEGIGDPLLNLGSFTAQGGFLDPGSNPFLSANIEASLRPITQEFAQNTLPNFQSQAIQSGAFSGSSARDLAFNQLASGFGQQLLDTGTGIAFENFQRERVLQQNAGQLIDQGALLNQLSPELLAQVGLGQRELAQRPLDEALLQFMEGINAPFRPLFPLASIIQGGDIGSAFSTTVPTPSGLSTGLLGALGGAETGANIFDLLGGTSDTGGQLSALLGALGGGAAGAFG